MNHGIVGQFVRVRYDGKKRSEGYVDLMLQFDTLRHKSKSITKQNSQLHSIDQIVMKGNTLRMN